MNTDRIKEIQKETTYPESVSVQQALLKVWNETEQEQLRIGGVSGQLPTNKEIDLILEQDIPLSEEYQKYSEREKILIMASVKAGAKWFRTSLIEGNFR